MKVYYVNQYAITPDVPGASRHFEMSKAMLQYGVKAEVIAADLNLETREYFRRQGGNKVSVQEYFEGVEFHWLYTSRYATNNWRRIKSMLHFSWNALAYLRGIDKPAAIIGSSPHIFAALAAHRVASWRKVPFVLEVRDIWPQTMVDMQGRTSLTSRILDQMADYLYARSDHIITMAKGTNDFLAAKGISPSKMTYIPNGVDVERFPSISREEKIAVRSKYGLPKDRVLFIYAGAHGQANGLEVAVDAAGILKDDPTVGIVFVGDGTEKAQLQLSVRERKLDNVYFLEPVPKSAIPELLGSMDAGLLLLRDVPVFRYGISPNKLFDYWAARLPVIATTPGEIGDLVEEANAGIQTAPGQPTELAQIIASFASSPAHMVERGLSGRKFVATRFARSVLARELAELVKRLA